MFFTDRIMTLQEVVRDLPYTFKGRKADYCVRVSIFLAVCLFVSLFFTVIYLAVAKNGCSSSSNIWTNGFGKDFTSGYIEGMANVLNNMDPTAQPCEDFYQYACGGWINKSIIESYGYVSTRDQLRTKYKDRWRTILEKPARDKSENSAERKMREIFQQCTQEYGNMRNGSKVFVEDLRKQLQGWYVTDPNTWRQKWNLTHAFVASTSWGYGYVLFGLFPGKHESNRNKTFVTVSNATP